MKFTRQLTQLCIAVLILSGCRPTTHQNKETENSDGSARAINVRFENSTLTINDDELTFPCRVADLTHTFGPPDRIANLMLTISTWDKYGVIAYEETSGSPITEIKFYFQKSDENFCPKSTFNGTVEYGGKKLDPKITQRDLIGAGLVQNEILPYCYIKEDGKFTITANFEKERWTEKERLTTISIGR